MNKIVILLTILLLLGACSGSRPVSPIDIDATISAGIAQTQQANPTSTPTEPPTPTLTPTNTAPPTDTPAPTATSTPAPTPTSTRQAIHNGDCLPTNTQRQVGVVTAVIDGDTIAVEIDGTKYVVRYIGIDSPESTSDAFAEEASNQNKALVLGKTVTLITDTSEVDRYDRLLRYVTVDDVFVNEALVRLGMAVAVSYPPDTACLTTFREAQGAAELGLLGMWAAPLLNPTACAGDALFPTLPAPTAQPSLCNCAVDYDCKDFSTHAEAQACFDSCGGSPTYNWSGMDGDHDGQACESLP